MDLVYIDDCIIPSRYANSIQVMKMCQAFSKNGHDVTLLVPDRNGIEIDVDDVFEHYGVDPCFDVRKLPRPNLSAAGTLVANYRIGRAAARLDPDLVYGRSMLACYFAATAGAPTAWESHEPITHRRFGRVQQSVSRRLIRHPKFVGQVVISEALRRYYRRNYPPLDDVVVAHDGADAVDESTEPVDFQGADDRIQVGYVGHLYQGRGVDVIVDLATRCQWADFHVVGGNPEDVDRWREETRSDNVTFHGFKPPNELDRFRLAFDVQLAPYQPDLKTGAGTNTVQWMSPLKIFEYMAAGRAIVASDLASIEAILEPERTALLCDPEDVTEWAAAMERLRADEEFREGLGRRARAEFLDNYTWEERARRILAEVAPVEPMIA